MPSLADLRRDYTLAGLSEAEAGTDPFALFQKWFDQASAANLLEPNAFTLATATPTGVPSARTVLLKFFDQRGFCFFTNYNSRKGDELAANPNVAMMFLWHELERQVRIEGRAEKTTTQESDDYYRQRPLGSRLGAWSSPQSEVIAGRHVLEEQQKQLLAKYAEVDPPRPEHWGGYRIVPTVFEFWHGRPSRLHDRIRFQLMEGVWVIDRLAP
jgi:pyridoxamine 5'-phosphate oxidase